MNRTERLESELAKFSTEQLNTPMHDLEVSNGYNIAEIDALVSEVGEPSSKVYVNNGRGWSKTLRETITELVDSLYTLDGETFETLEELETFREPKPTTLRITKISIFGSAIADVKHSEGSDRIPLNSEYHFVSGEQGTDEKCLSADGADYLESELKRLNRCEDVTWAK